MMNVVHLTASTFYGGPERQILGLTASLPEGYRTIILSFSEWGRCRAFLDEALGQGFEAAEIEHDTPRLRLAIRELADRLRSLRADVLCCHGYKAGLLGRIAARRVGVPVIAVSRGWTYESPKVRLYEALDRINLRWMDRVVCVSEGQAAKVRRAGVPVGRIAVIRNAIEMGRFTTPDPLVRRRLAGLFAEASLGPIVGAAGRLSPEKGFGVLIEAAALTVRAAPAVRFIVFGDGRLRTELVQQIARHDLAGRFVLAGFRTDLDQILPCLDLMVLSSFTEGLPNVILEAFAAGVPAVATAVGGTPEVVQDGFNGYLVPPNDPAALASRMLNVLGSESVRRSMGIQARQHVVEYFGFGAQSQRYQRLFASLAAASAVSLRSWGGGTTLPLWPGPDIALQDPNTDSPDMSVSPT